MTTVAPIGLGERLEALFSAEPWALANPWPIYRELHERGPVYGFRYGTLVSRHADAKLVLQDEARFLERAGEGRLGRETLTGELEEQYEVLARFESAQLSLADGAQHERLRRISHRAFTPRRIALLEGAIQRYTDEFLDPVVQDGVGDLMTFAYALPLGVICDMLGVPPEDRELLHGWSGAIGRFKGPVIDAESVRVGHRAVLEFEAYVEAMLEEGRGEMTEIVASLVDATEEDRLTSEELSVMFVMLLFAGHETTTNLIGTGVLELLRHRDQWEALSADPAGLAGRATEELLRFVSPVQWMPRVAIVDSELSGVPVPTGRVFAMLAAANRDPEIFSDPDVLDITRLDAKEHIAFGFGRHYCLGAALARLEGVVALRTLATRFPGMQLEADELEWEGSVLLRRLKRLPLRFS